MAENKFRRLPDTSDSESDDEQFSRVQKSGGILSINDEAMPPANDHVVVTPPQRVPVFRQNNPVRTDSVYESLDYEVCENQLWREEQSEQSASFDNRKDFARWMVFICIGILTGLVACSIDIVIEELSAAKYSLLKNSVDANIKRGYLFIPYLLWILCNVGIVAISSILCTYVEPVAAGSGIPQVKCYLNGVKIPRLVRIKTLFIKAIGVATAVVGGLAGGKEGPMVHSGAVIGAGISQGKSTTFRRDFGMLKYFRDDHEKRDFVVGGASAGVSAAFGAPLGGVLFSLEEAASFWDQNLIWRTLVSSVISSFTLNVVLSAYYGLKTFSIPGLFNLGEFEPLPYDYYEIPIFVLMGALGGLFGALWNMMNTQLNIFRGRFIKWKWARVFEACLVASVTATLACVTMFAMNDCRPLGNDPTSHPLQLFCEDSEYNAVAALWFQTPEASVKALFHDPPGSHKILSLIVFVALYFPLSCVTFGLSVSLGIFIPTLLVGAAWGRVIAMTVEHFIPTASVFMKPGKYALIGAAAQLGGVLRMTISLSVILIESTGNIAFALPLIVTLISAKWCGDYFNDGIYDTQIIVSNVPLLPRYAPRAMKELKACDIMSSPVVCIRMRESVRYIYDILKKYSYNGFPVIDEVDEDRVDGRIRGLMLRSQLIIILKRKYYEEKQRLWREDCHMDVFRSEYPRFPSIDKMDLDLKTDFTINSEMFMNPSPHTVQLNTSVPNTFQSFRGKRHLVVVDADNRVKGMITRKDLISSH